VPSAGWRPFTFALGGFGLALLPSALLIGLGSWSSLRWEWILAHPPTQSGTYALGGVDRLTPTLSLASMLALPAAFCLAVAVCVLAYVATPARTRGSRWVLGLFVLLVIAVLALSYPDLRVASATGQDVPLTPTQALGAAGLWTLAVVAVLVIAFRSLRAMAHRHEPQTASPTAGWYADPSASSAPAAWRWWDGTGWTDHTG
jgi:hypothetical protein